jgi:hypothetical protein
MEVHTPDHPVHSWRDFAIHIVIVTIGLFIALTLESFVEYLHHRHIVHEARENIRQEIGGNHRAAQADIKYLQEDMDRIKANIDTIHQLRAQPKGFKGSLTYTMQFTSLDSAAWNTSRDTGALSFMPYKEVQIYAGLYEEQKMVNDHSIQIFYRQTLAMTPVFMEDELSNLPPSETLGMLHESAATLIDLNALQQIVQQLDARYVEQLKKSD